LSDALRFALFLERHLGNREQETVVQVIGSMKSHAGAALYPPGGRERDATSDRLLQ
jgi:hypothetical protein